MLQLRHLRTLLALAETGNLSRAAKRLHLSQPAISHQVRLLEEHYKGGLFERKSDPLKLSPLGRRMVELGYEIERRMQDAERDLLRIASGEAGQLRIAVECHSCFDWLMPAMDSLREHRPEVEMDLVSGFHAEPVGLLNEGRADLVIVSRAAPHPGVVYHPLFRYEVLAMVARHHPLARKPYLTARDFEGETLVTYPIPDERIDVIRDVLKPAGVAPQRRATEMTVAILQLVASHRGIAALPGWTVQPFLDRNYVAGLPIGKNGLFSNLYVAIPESLAHAPYLLEFVQTIRRSASRISNGSCRFPKRRQSPGSGKGGRGARPWKRFFALPSKRKPLFPYGSSFRQNNP